MTSSHCIIAADVGNSAVKLCVQQGDAPAQKTIIDKSIPIAGEAWGQDALQWVRRKAGCKEIEWRIASVRRDAAQQLADCIANQPSDVAANVTLVSHRDVPMKTLVQEPDRLGIDRLLSAFAAANQFGSSLAVVDAGSAVTIDYVNENSEFVGGAILPGLALQTKSLASGTDLLPHVQFGNESDSLEIPGTATAQAIRLGVLMGVAGAIDRIVAAYRNEPSLSVQNLQIVITGGDAVTLSPYVLNQHHLAPNLVCRGLLGLNASSLDESRP